LHDGELRIESGLYFVFVVRVMRKIHENSVGVDDWIFGRVNPCKVLVFNENMALC
jgi:hypothetical protein